MLRATISDVAKLAECSITCVSLVLNNKHCNVSDATRKRIFDAADTLNYQPNKLAAGLASGKAKTLGLIIPDNLNPFFATILNLVEKEAGANGYRVISANSQDRVANDIVFLSDFLGYCVSGIVIVRSTFSCADEQERLHDMLRNLSTPTVAIDREVAETGIPMFMVDNRYGGYLATRHLIDNGHSKIGCYAGPLHAASAVQRLEGYKDALIEASIPFDSNLVFEGDYKTVENTGAFKFFASRNVTGIFSHNDMQAFGLYKDAKLSGMSIPEDYSVVGFDDMIFSSIITPGLTTIHYTMESMMHDALNLLFSMIDGGADNKGKDLYHLYEPQLIVRESVKKIR